LVEEKDAELKHLLGELEQLPEDEVQAQLHKELP
jgi:hypothetical protein